jgi:hypothetical protein
MRPSIVFTPVIAALSLALLPPAWGAASGGDLREQAERAIKNLKSADSALTNFFENSAGYAVFPNVRRTGLNPPEEQVRGVVYGKGKPVGEAVLAEMDSERGDGASPFHEVIFFETAEALENLKQGRFAVSTDISALDAAEGAAMAAKYRNGVVVFAIPKNGRLEKVTIGHQKFSYRPLD